MFLARVIRGCEGFAFAGWMGGDREKKEVLVGRNFPLVVLVWIWCKSGATYSTGE